MCEAGAHEFLYRSSHWFVHTGCRVARLKDTFHSLCTLQSFDMAMHRHHQRRQTELSVSAGQSEGKKEKLVKSERTNERKLCRLVRHEDSGAQTRHNFQCRQFFLSTFLYRPVIFWCLLPGSAPMSPFVPDAVLVMFSVLQGSKRIGPRTTATSEWS